MPDQVQPGQKLANLNIPISTLTNTFSNYAKRVHTRQDKHYLFSIVEGLGTQILQHNRTAGGNDGGFNMDEWMTECGVDPQWATIAA